MPTTTDQSETVTDANEVRLVGRISQPPQEREMPSGDLMWSFRVVVRRPVPVKGRPSVDALDCVVWSARMRRSVARWSEGDIVEVAGALRRRFLRGAGGGVSRHEVEVVSGRRVRRARDA